MAPTSQGASREAPQETPQEAPGDPGSPPPPGGPGRLPYASWRVLAALGPALGAVWAVEAARALPSTSANPLAKLGALLPALLGASARVALALLGLGLLLALAFALRARRPRLGDLALGDIALGDIALFGLGWAEVGYAREHLIAHGPFAWSVPVTLALAALGSLLGLSWMWLARPALAPRLRRPFGALALLASLAAALLHYRALVGTYFSWHATMAVLAAIGAHLGLSFLLPEEGPRRPRRPRLLALGASLSLALLLLAPLFALLPEGAIGSEGAAAEGRGLLIGRTALARQALIERAIAAHEAELLPRRGARPRRRPDPEAEALFARHSGLPPLPDALRLDDRSLLFVLIEATRFDHTSLTSPSAADPATDTTPRMRALLEGGALSFRRAYAPSNGTFPSLASLLAMTYPSHAPMLLRGEFWKGRLERGPTVAEAFREAGYRTFWIGHDYKGCFSENIGGLERGFEERLLLPQRPGEEPDADARIADRAIAHLEHMAAPGAPPFFGLVFFASPHDDYQRHHPADRPEGRRSLYDQEVAFADAQLGRLLDALEALGLDERTVVVVSGDHGEALGEHGQRFHLSSVYDEQLHVPLLVRVPGLPGGEVEAPTSTLYVLPWLLRRGRPPLARAARRAVAEELAPMMRATEGAVISEMIGPSSQLASLRYADLSVHYDVFAGFSRVFDPRRDPGEARDLREARPTLLRRADRLGQAYREARFDRQRFRFDRSVFNSTIN